MKINRDKAYELGVSAEDISRTIETLLASNRVTTYASKGLTYNVIVQAEKSFRVTPDNLDNIFIKSSKSSTLIPLSNLIYYNETSSSESLKRINRMPSTIFSASLLPGYPLGDALEEFTLLANDMDQLYTGSTDTYRAAFPERKKQSGVNKGAEQIYEPEGYEEYKIIVLDKEDWNPSVGGSRGSQNNEALVDNWSPLAIIVPDSSNQPGYWDEDLQKMEPAGPDTAEADIVWQPLLDKAGLDIPVMTHIEFTSRGWA